VEPVAQQTALDRVLIGGMAWMALLRWSAQIVSWVGTAVAARILKPGDYGLVGMAMLAIGFVRMVEDFGMDAVLVQDRTIQGRREAELAGFILLAGAVFAGVFLLLSTPIASFFNEPQVAVLIIALSGLCIADALQVIPRAALQRKMQFRRLALLQLVQVIATQVVLIACAYLGLGVWSLVLNSLTGALVVTLVLLWWSPFTVRWPHAIVELSAPLLQGWRILMSRFAWYAYTSADQAVIGRLLGKDSLGVYSFAMTFSTMISQEISSVLSRVVPGVFSAVQSQQSELRRYFGLLTELLCFVALPVSFGMIVTADLVVAIALGPQWDAVVVPLRILSVYAAFYSCQVLVGHLLLWTGRFRANMWCSVLAAAGMPVCFLVGAQWGLPGIAWAWVVGFPLFGLPSFVIAFRTIAIGGWDWLRIVHAPLVGCMTMVAAVALVRASLPPGLPAAVVAFASVTAGAAVYTATLLLFFRSRVQAVWAFLRVIRSGPGNLDAVAAIG
jgi:O-antigen/teichoic acid export membrane protein